jgi:hypothetical protein
LEKLQSGKLLPKTGNWRKVGFQNEKTCDQRASILWENNEVKGRGDFGFNAEWGKSGVTGARFWGRECQRNDNMQSVCQKWGIREKLVSRTIGHATKDASILWEYERLKWRT